MKNYQFTDSSDTDFESDIPIKELRQQQLPKIPYLTIDSNLIEEIVQPHINNFSQIINLDFTKRKKKGFKLRVI